MSEPAAREEMPKMAGHQVRDLMLALVRAVLWPFRWHVALILAMQVVSQLLLLASLVLPWQLLLVLTTGHSQFDGWFIGASNSLEWVTLLAVLATCCFGGYALLRWGIKQATAALSQRILGRLNKTRLMNHHQLVGRRVVGVVMGALSSTLVALLFLGVIALLHPLLALLMAAIVLGFVGLVVGRYRFERIQRLQDSLQGQLLTLVNVGLVLGFLVMVHDYLSGSLRPLLTLFIVLLALRQLMAASVNALVNFLGIIKRFRQINMLLLPRSQQIQLFAPRGFVQRFDQVRPGKWLTPWLHARLPEAEELHILQCRLLYRHDVAQVVIHQSCRDGAKRYLLLKFYEPARENEAQHEVALLSALSGHHLDDTALVPRLLESGRLSWCFFIVLETGDTPPQWKSSLQRKPWTNRLRQRLARTPLPDTLIARYRATFAALPERMGEIDASRFDYLTSDDRSVFKVDRLMTSWSRMTALVEKVPQHPGVQNPDIARLAVIDDEILLLDWQGWIFDTLGAYWPLSTSLYAEAREVLTALWQAPDVRLRWVHFESLSEAADHLVLAVRAHEFCRRYHDRNDAGALNLINGLLEALDAIDQPGDVETAE